MESSITVSYTHLDVYKRQVLILTGEYQPETPRIDELAMDGLREDVRARDKELIDNPEFAITIGKATYTCLLYTSRCV